MLRLVTYICSGVLMPLMHVCTTSLIHVCLAEYQSIFNAHEITDHTTMSQSSISNIDPRTQHRRGNAEFKQSRQRSSGDLFNNTIASSASSPVFTFDIRSRLGAYPYKSLSLIILLTASCFRPIHLASLCSSIG